MWKTITRESLAKERVARGFAKGVQLSEFVKMTPQGGVTLAEFIGNGDFGAAFREQELYMVAAGRDEEPILYDSIYDVIENADLPQNVNVNKMNEAGVVFEEVKEGGEVKFATIDSTSYTVPIKNYAVGMEYTEDLFLYNRVWDLQAIQRRVGVAYNALLNHIHMNPILVASYGAANQTAASAVGSTLTEKTMNTIQDAITNARTDTANPRYGPYAILCSTSNLFQIENALKRTLQDGGLERSSAVQAIRAVVAYDGWSGTRGLKSVTYNGVTANKCYLVSLRYRGEDFQSFFKQGLTEAMGNADISRFILEQRRWNTRFGVYANPTAAAEEVTLPTS